MNDILWIAAFAADQLIRGDVTEMTVEYLLTPLGPFVEVR